MKRFTKVALVLLMAFCLVFVTACGNDSGSKTENNEKMDYKLYDQYEDVTLADYVTLPDYNSYDVKKPTVTVTDEEVDEEIQARLAATGTKEEVTEGICEIGDTLNIDFAGTLADGSTIDGMNAEGQQVTLGAGGFIEGFLESMEGASVGDVVTAELVFPDPYDINPDLAGQPVTFKITINSKIVTTPAEFNDEFCAKDSGDTAKTTEEYKALLKEYLEAVKLSDAEYDVKTDLYNKIADETADFAANEDKVAAYSEQLNGTYEKMAKFGSLEMDDFISQQFNMSREDYDKFIQEYSESIVKGRMVIYALAQAEGVSVTEEEYGNYLTQLCMYSGFQDASKFEETYGITIEEYADGYNGLANLALDKALGVIYDRIAK